MPVSIIGEDCAISIALSTRNIDGTLSSYLANANIKGIAKRVSLSESADMKSGKAMGDGTDMFRATAAKAELEIDHMVAVAGYYYNTGTTIVGKIATVTFLERTGLSDTKTYTGVIETWKGEAADGEMQMEKITIRCNAC